MIKLYYDSAGIILEAFDSIIPTPERLLNTFFIEVSNEVWDSSQEMNNLIVDNRLVSTEPIINITDFDIACNQFKTVCTQIGTATNNPNFKGGFDEYGAFIQSSFAQSNPAQAALLAAMWSGANEYAKYEGNKLGYGQPDWWYKCWNIEREV